MKGTYPIVITQEDTGFIVYIPDFDINTESDSLDGAIEMARDAIGLTGITMEDVGRNIPSPHKDIARNEQAQDGERYFYVDVDFDEYRKNMA